MSLRRIYGRLILAVMAGSLAATTWGTSTGTGGGRKALPHHCNSDELQNQSCTNPGSCYNACAFWCRQSLQECRACCAAFPAGSGARQRCNQECNSVWEQ